MTPRIETLNEKKLVGKRLTMSFANYKIGELWRSFTPIRKEITNNLTSDLISMVVYKPTHFADFKPTNEFELGCQIQTTFWTTDRILKCWATNTKTTTRHQKKRFGYR